ncbi:unnamed protein product [Brugia timori]|uniref:Prepilin-type N-terminal cleavage/methylation domain-containing protein n=1 Tax=Brugia timori TaxID=42155 RepID=A0A0R3QI13_9BILA|nr:unnamed protein product [Brugia timori]
MYSRSEFETSSTFKGLQQHYHKGIAYENQFTTLELFFFVLLIE